MADSTVEENEEERPIASLTWDCDELFQDCFARLGLSTGSTKELLGTYAQRFTSWWESLGVFAGQHADLDCRLQRQSDVRDIIIRLLLVLRRNLAHLISQKGGQGFLEGESLDEIKPINGSDGDSDDAVYLRSIFLDAIDGSLAKLNHIGNAIRQSARLPEVVRARTYASQHLHLTSYQALSTVALQTMYPDAPDSLISQLTESMVDRYALIFFRKFRKGILNKDTRDVQARGGSAARDGRSPAQRFEASPPVAGTALPQPEDPAKAHEHRPSEFAPTSHNTGQLRERLRQENDARTRPSTTVILSNSKEPPISGTRNEYGEEVPCRWCFEKVGRELVKNNRWTAVGREHYRADLRPFVCIAAHCIEADNAFPSTRAWAQHMAEHHSAWAQHIHQEPVWVCNIPTEEGLSGDHATFPSVRRLRHHLQMMHPAAEDTTAAQALLEAPVTVSPREASTCLLCGFELEMPHILDETTILQDVVPSMMISHVAEHLQNIMVLSLRLLGTQEEVDESANSVVSENDSLATTSKSDGSFSSAGQALSSFASQPRSIHEAEEAVAQMFFAPEDTTTSADNSSTIPWGKNIDIWMGTVPSDQTSGKELDNMENLSRNGFGFVAGNGAPQNKGPHVQSYESEHPIKSEEFTGLQSSDTDPPIHRLSKDSLVDLDDARDSEIKRPYASQLGPVPDASEHLRETGDDSDSQSFVSDAGEQFQLQHRLVSTDSPEQVSLAGELQDMLINRLQRVYDGNDLMHQFLPIGDLDRLVNETSVRHELKKVLAGRYDELEIEHCVTEICRERPVLGARWTITSFRKIFALLVILDATICVRTFLDEDVSDVDLPLQWESTAMLGLCRKDAARMSTPPLLCFTMWSRVKLHNFFEFQWKLLAVFFHEDGSGSLKHYILHDQHILPFLKLDKLSPGEEEKTGGFAKIKMVQIHPAHHNFSDASLNNRGFAIKQQLFASDTDVYRREIAVLRKFSGHRGHHHIVSLLATFEQFGKLNLIFYRAEADLSVFWSRNMNPPLGDHANVTWLAAQCEGLSDGLLKVHRYSGSELEHDIPFQIAEDDRLPVANTETSNPVRRHRTLYGHHGNIQPEHILWYDDSEAIPGALQGTLKLAHFGQAELGSHRSEGVSPSVLRSVTYRPPESNSDPYPGNSLDEQACDIWCLGCVYLEFVTWFLGGEKLLRQFVRRRLTPVYLESSLTTDTFFQTITIPESDSHEVVVKEQVTEFIDDLHKHPRCTEFFHDFLYVIQNDILVVNLMERRGCEEVWRALGRMSKRCIKDEGYAVRATPWRLERSVSRPITLQMRDAEVAQKPEALSSKGPTGAGKPEMTVRSTKSRRKARFLKKGELL